MESSAQKSKDRLELFLKIARPIGTLILWIVLNKGYDFFSNKVQRLEYTVASSGSMNNMLGHPNILKINEVAVKDAGLITVNVFNDTKSDYDSLTVQMQIPDTTKPVSVDYGDFDGSKVRIKYRKNGDIHLFTVHPVNRTDDGPFLKATFIVENITNADCKVTVQKAGVETQRVMAQSAEEKQKKSILLVAIGTCICLIFALVTIYTLLRLTRKHEGEIRAILIDEINVLKRDVQFYKDELGRAMND